MLLLAANIDNKIEIGRCRRRHRRDSKEVLVRFFFSFNRTRNTNVLIESYNNILYDILYTPAHSDVDNHTYVNYKIYIILLFNCCSTIAIYKEYSYRDIVNLQPIKIRSNDL